MRYAVILCASLSLLLVVSGSSAASSTATDELRLMLPKAGSLEPELTSRFYEQALQLALEKTRRKSELIHFDYYPADVNRERTRLLVKQGKVDVIWSSSNKNRETELTPIRFNLIRGINEYRLLLIRTGEQPRFDKVKTLTDLRKFKIGTGIHWSDTDIYKFNGLPLVTAYSYKPMFRMLSANRFDYMARSIQEVNYELEHYGNSGLTIEKNLAIHYPQPIYFFVNHNHRALAQRIQKGLEIARDDGSLDTLFFSIPNFRQAWEQLQKLNRHVIELNVPE
jgi:ABC-type amino acid transport substrate-binding protein